MRSGRRASPRGRRCSSAPPAPRARATISRRSSRRARATSRSWRSPPIDRGSSGKRRRQQSDRSRLLASFGAFRPTSSLRRRCARRRSALAPRGRASRRPSRRCVARTDAGPGSPQRPVSQAARAGHRRVAGGVLRTSRSRASRRRGRTRVIVAVARRSTRGRARRARRTNRKGRAMGLIVAGPSALAAAGDRDAAFELSRRSGFPLLAEATSQLRFRARGRRRRRDRRRRRPPSPGGGARRRFSTPTS